VPRAIAPSKNAAATQIRQVPGTSGRGVRAAVAGASGEEPLIVVVMSLPPAWLAHAPQGAPLVLTSKHPCWVPVLSSLAFCAHPAVPCSTRSGVRGRVRYRTPVACHTAFAIAAIGVLEHVGTVCKMSPTKPIDASAFLEDMQRQEHAGIAHRAGREHGSIWLAP
jgi:hypothetical protein